MIKFVIICVILNVSGEIEDYYQVSNREYSTYEECTSDATELDIYDKNNFKVHICEGKIK